MMIMISCFSVMFLFSSRRRHTRFSRDWSSDVCSSDLQHEPGPTLTVVPSANVRTVFVVRHGSSPVVPHFVKLHYPRRLSRFTRRLRRPIISVQLWVAAELLRVGTPVLPEVGAGV